MKTIIYKIAVFLLLIPVLSYAGTPKGKYKKTKHVSKTYQVNQDTKLNLENMYGNIDIVTWDKNTIEIDVKITVSGNNEDKIEDRLDQIRIEFSQSNNQVYATTHIKSSSSWLSNSFIFSWGSNSKTNLEINYTVKMPRENNLHVTNDYGTIILDELNGKANINCDYGKILIGSLNNTINTININYTNHSVIDFINNGTINADYSGFTIEKANNIELQADYTSSKLEFVNNLEYNCDYGSVKVGEANIIDGKGDYLSLQIGEVNTSVDIEASFGSIKIASLNKGFEFVRINADYTGVKINIDKTASCQINANVSYGSIKYYGDLFTFNRIKEKSNNKNYEGYFQNENSTARIDVSAEYGSIKLYQN